MFLEIQLMIGVIILAPIIYLEIESTFLFGCYTLWPWPRYFCDCFNQDCTESSSCQKYQSRYAMKVVGRNWGRAPLYVGAITSSMGEWYRLHVLCAQFNGSWPTSLQSIIYALNVVIMTFVTYSNLYSVKRSSTRWCGLAVGLLNIILTLFFKLTLAASNVIVIVWKQHPRVYNSDDH